MRLPLIIGALAAAATPALAAPPAGDISLAQFRDQRVAALMRMDTDRDGRVSQAELQAFQAGRKHPGKGGGGKLFAKADADRDGYISRGEIERMAEKRFAKLDANGDGKLAADERPGHHGAMGGQ